MAVPSCAVLMQRAAERSLLGSAGERCQRRCSPLLPFLSGVVCQFTPLVNVMCDVVCAQMLVIALKDKDCNKVQQTALFAICVFESLYFDG